MVFMMSNASTEHPQDAAEQDESLAAQVGSSVEAEPIIEDEDLLSSMLEEIASPSGERVEDFVEAIYGATGVAHGKYCEYVPFVNQHGVIFCMACGGSVGSVCDISDCFCPRCGCPNSTHLNGRCLLLVDGKPCPCNDDHKASQSSSTTQQEEAKVWLRKRQQRQAKERAKREQDVATPTC